MGIAPVLLQYPGSRERAEELDLHAMVGCSWAMFAHLCQVRAVSRATPVPSPWATPGKATERSWGDCRRWVEAVGGAKALDELTAWAGLHVRPGLASTLSEENAPCRV